MECVFNICEFWGGIGIGILSSVIVSFITYFIVNYRNKDLLKRKFGKAEGEYSGYGFEPIDRKDSTKGTKWILNNDKLSSAKIEYVKENVLTIEHITLRNKFIWKGNIEMESETTGSIPWLYVNLPKDGEKDQHQFGHKRCIIRETDDEIYVYLIGDKLEGYGKEVLIRSK